MLYSLCQEIHLQALCNFVCFFGVIDLLDIWFIFTFQFPCQKRNIFMLKRNKQLATLTEKQPVRAGTRRKGWLATLLDFAESLWILKAAKTHSSACVKILCTSSSQFFFPVADFNLKKAWWTCTNMSWKWSCRGHQRSRQLLLPCSLTPWRTGHDDSDSLWSQSKLSGMTFFASPTLPPTGGWQTLVRGCCVWKGTGVCTVTLPVKWMLHVGMISSQPFHRRSSCLCLWQSSFYIIKKKHMLLSICHPLTTLMFFRSRTLGKKRMKNLITCCYVVIWMCCIFHIM